MSRTPVSVRAAGASDVASLRELWGDILRKGGLDEQLADVARVVAVAAAREDQCVAVAEIDGEVAGAVYLEATTFTPLNLEPAVLAVSPHVFPQFRRKGVGSALMEAACRFAEQHGVTHVQTAAAAEARDANRFMARLSFAPQAMLRRRDDERRARPPAAVAPGDAGRDEPPAHRPGAGGATDPARARPRLRAVPGPRPRRSALRHRHQRAGDPRGAHALAALVGDDDLVGRRRPAEVDRGGDAR